MEHPTILSATFDYPDGFNSCPDLEYSLALALIHREKNWEHKRHIRGVIAGIHYDIEYRAPLTIADDEPASHAWSRYGHEDPFSFALISKNNTPKPLAFA